MWLNVSGSFLALDVHIPPILGPTVSDRTPEGLVPREESHKEKEGYDCSCAKGENPRALL